ncbi:putative regulator of septum formation [Labedella gwakjiensis]|nr:septum formation family protein [Labedella gwakjiensis]PSL36968.1 putative regulator of septum formation [Labedella gwakjiensis]
MGHDVSRLRATAPMASALVILSAALLAGCASSPPTPDEPTEAAVSLSPERQSRFVAATGECYVDDPTGEVEINGLVDCEEPHDYEIYYAEELPDGEFPGTTKVRESAELICAKQLPVFLGAPSAELGLEYFAITPTVTMWDGDGDRGVSCAVTDPDGPVTGTLQNAGA